MNLWQVVPPPCMSSRWWKVPKIPSVTPVCRSTSRFVTVQVILRWRQLLAWQQWSWEAAKGYAIVDGFQLVQKKVAIAAALAQLHVHSQGTWEVPVICICIKISMFHFLILLLGCLACLEASANKAGQVERRPRLCRGVSYKLTETITTEDVTICHPDRQWCTVISFIFGIPIASCLWHRHKFGREHGAKKWKARGLRPKLHWQSSCKAKKDAIEATSH